MQNWFTAVWAFAFRPRSDFIAVHARDCTGKVGPGCLARATIFTKSFRGVVLSQHCLIRCSLYRSVSRCLSPGFIRSTLMVNEKSKRGRKLCTKPRSLHTNASKHVTTTLKATFNTAVQSSFEYLCNAAELQP